jgi:methionyl-tRNA formyltransferase
MKKKKNVVILGKGTLAIRVSQWFLEHPDYILSAIVPVIPEPSWTESLVTWAKKNKIPLIMSGNYNDLLQNPLETPIDLAVSIFYDKIIKKDFIDACKKIINIHNGPLPRYRGVSPINWALKNNEYLHGVTIHEITAGIDDGPIISQVQYSIYPNLDEVRDVYLRAIEFAWVLFVQTMPIIEKIIPQPQIESKALYYSAKQNSMLEERRYFTKKEFTKHE